MKKQSLRINNKTIYSLLILLCIIGFWIFQNFYTPANYTEPIPDPGLIILPEYLVPGSTTGAVVKHRYYWLSYNERYEQAEWVAYKLERSHLTYDDRKRPFFIEDPKINSKSADWRNYKGSGFDRGHLCPAGDRRFSEYAYKETFYTSNITPQKRDFNAGIWNRLEMKVRSWGKRYESLYIITGGILEKGLPGIGEEDVAVPETFYKIVARGRADDLKILAFLIPHRETTSPLHNYLVPVDTIEQLSCINFFEKLPDEYEDELEKKVIRKNWKF